jgi:hypothetical protein
MQHQINTYAKLVSIQKLKGYSEAGEHHHDNAGGSWKLSAVAAASSNKMLKNY